MVKSSNRRRASARRAPRSKSSMLSEERKQTRHLDNLERYTQQGQMIPKVLDVSKMLMKRDKVYTIQRSTGVGPFTGVNTSESSAALYFTLSSLPASTEFTSLFDQYRIIQVTLKFTPRTGPIGGYQFRPNYFQTAIDYDDVNTVTSTQILQYNTYCEHRTDQPFERTLNPRIALAAYNGISTTGYTNTRSWIDVAYPDVQHFGLKIIIPFTTNNAIPENVLDCVATYTISFRNPR